MLRVARRSAIKARTQAINALRSVLVTAPPELREQLGARSTSRAVEMAARLRPALLGSPLAASKLALRQLARRCQTLEAEITNLDAELAQLTAARRVRKFGQARETARFAARSSL